MPEENMCAGWVRKPLEQCVESIIDYRGKTPIKTSFGVPLITAKVIKNGRIDWDNVVEFISEDDYESWMKRGIPVAGAVVITTEAPLGEVAQLGTDKIALAQRVITLCGKVGMLNNTFLRYLLQTNYVQGQLLARGSGTTVTGIKQSELRKVLLPFPPIPEQRAIAAILSALDDKIELNRQMNRTLEEMAQAIFKQWFVDFDFPNESNQPYMSSGGEMEDSDMSFIPKGWAIVGFEELFNFQEGPGIRNWQYVTENGTNFINIRCIQNNDLQLKTANMISNEEANGKYSHFMLKEWDVVVSSSGTLGRYAIVRKEHLPLCLNTSVIRFSPIEKFEDFSFMFGYLTSAEFYEHLITMACGSVQANFGPMHLRQIRIVCPSKEIMYKYHEIVFPLIKKSIQIRSENQNLSAIRDTLLPKLMSGELLVPVPDNVG